LAQIAPGVRSDQDVFGNLIVRSPRTPKRAAGIETAADDVLMGSDADEAIAGRQGNDSLDGSGGNDCLNGGQGDDTLLGGAGDDQLSGDLGNDWLTGGPGADRFQLSDGQDVITDFEDGQDRLVLPAGLTFADLSLTAEDNALRLTWNNAQGQHSTLLSNLTPAQITAEDFLSGS
jgi:Ca2+-binding RTX toxin-like protein